MALIRWNRTTDEWPLPQLSRLREQVNDLINSPAGDLARSPFFDAWGPAMDVFEDRDSVTVRLEVPGMRKENLELSLHDGALTIAGERKADDKFKTSQPYRLERAFGRFQRSIALPTAVNGDATKAVYKDGVLTVVLPKREDAKPKQIAINVQ